MPDSALLGLLATYKYVIMAPAALLFGPIVSLASGFLVRLGVVALLPSCIALAAGELTGDVLWYWLGIRYGERFVGRFGHHFGITEERLTSAKELFHRYHDPIILISKLTAGFGFAPAIFFTAGLSRVHFGRYMALNIAGQIVWTTVLIALGYSIGHLYAQVGTVIGRVFFAAFVILVLAAVVAFARQVQQHMLE